MKVTGKKVAIVYDRVNKWGGAERVLLSLHKLFPHADLYTSVYDPVGASWAQVFPHIYTSFLQNVPFARKNHEVYASLMPLAFEKFDFSMYDLVISVTSEAAKGIITTGNTYHVSYCLTPTRYLWSGYNTYFADKSFKKLSSPIINYLKKWDFIAAQRPDKMIGISTEVQKRIKNYYRRNVEIIFPPVETDLFPLKSKNSKRYYLLVSRLVNYKKVDLAIKAFNELKLPLLVVGTGRAEKRLRKIAHRNIRFLGKVSDYELQKAYSNAKALIFPQEEDFGIVAVEAQSSGVPVVAYGKGGALDTVIEGQTGIFFDKQTVESLINAVKLIDRLKFSSKTIKDNADQFSKERFLTEFAKMLETL